MLKIAICDDDKLYLEMLSLRIQKVVQKNIGTECQISCFSNIETFLKQIKSNKPDLVFLDIMINDTNTVNFLAMHGSKIGNIPFIIMTAFPTETENLSEIDCCYFLLKAKLTDERLLRAIKKAIGLTASELTHLEVLSINNKSVTIDFNSVLYIESYKNNLLIHCENDNMVTVRSTLKKIEPHLPPNFYQCHKSFIVNMNRVSGYEPHNFIFSPNTKVPIPPKKYTKIVAYYKSYTADM